MDGMESPGQLLQRSRREQGVTVKELSAITRIPPRLIQALEGDDFGELPGEVFVKGFLRNCAKELDLDPEMVIDRYLSYTGRAPGGHVRSATGEVEADGLDTLFKAPRIPRLSFALVLIAIILGLALSIFIFGSPDTDELTDSQRDSAVDTWHQD